MRQGIIGGVIGLVLGAGAMLMIGAVDTDDRDACARLADLSATFDSNASEREAFWKNLENDKMLVRECLKG